MKNNKIFILLALFLTIFLASCGSENTEVIEDTTENNTENTQVLEDINNELENIEQQDDIQSDNSANTETKVVKLNKVYTTPGGEDEVEFNITMNGNLIENVDTKLIVGGDISQARTKAFSDSVNTELKGKTLEEAAEISIIGGSSLTTGAFKSALKDMN
ncbi:MAG: hypothetical protein PHS49_00395 [Candidatus Gracilibacteria bacterium]|nr:hypothetical protein [Candidatus Gracilibacteria bacterium]